MAVTKRTRTSRTNRKRKTTFYEAQVYIDGVRVQTRSFTTRAAAELWHEQTRTALARRGDGPPVVDMTFAEAYRQYRKDAASRLRRSSQQSADARRRYFESGPLGKVRMRRFNAQVIDAWITWLLAHKSAANPGRRSFQIELKLLGVVLNWYRNYRDPSFVVPIVKRHRERCRYKQVAPRRPDYYMRPEEVERWISWLREHRRPVYHHLATFMVLTGVRVGEACGLDWRHVDLGCGECRIVQTVTWDHQTRRPRVENAVKTDESARVLALAPELVEMLRLLRRESAAVAGPVFRDLGGGYLKYNAIQSAFNAGFKACGLPWSSTHICRHTNATLMLLATGDLSAVQAHLGHRSQRVTEKYAKAVASLNRGNVEKTAELIGLEL